MDRELVIQLGTMFKLLLIIMLPVWDVLTVRTLSTTPELQRIQVLLAVERPLGTYYRWNRLRTRLTCMVLVWVNTLRITPWQARQLAVLKLSGSSGGRS